MPRGMTLVLIAVTLASGCGGGPSAPTGTPATPSTPVGTIVYVDASLPAGSTVEVSPMYATGQQAPHLNFRATITLNRSVSQALVRAFVRTQAGRCMGGGQAGVDFQAGVPLAVRPAGMSNDGMGQPVCPLPYSTTHVEFEVISAREQLLAQSFAVPFNFVAAR